jgi:FkbM family methyltransferase
VMGLRTLKQSFLTTVPISIYCKYVNSVNFLRQRNYRIYPAVGESAEIHTAVDISAQIFICRRSRHRRYKSGVMTGIDRIANDYSLDALDHLRDGVFIDCGANVGELGFWARKRGFQYIAFEPELLESRCVDLNHFQGEPNCIRKALWKEDTTLRFFTRPDSADSSVLADEDGEQSVLVEATRLDSSVDLSSASGPIILKLEAEGAEPEVLEGAVNSLSRIDWVAIDCGFERGPEKSHTLVETNIFLNDHGFQMVSAKFPRMTALYRRVK